MANTHAQPNRPQPLQPATKKRLQKNVIKGIFCLDSPQWEAGTVASG